MDVSGAPLTLPDTKAPPSRFSTAFLLRLTLLLTLLIVEWSLISRFGHTGYRAPAVIRLATAMGVLLLGSAYLRSKKAIQSISHKITGVQVSWGFFAAHLCAMVLFLALSSSRFALEASGLTDSLVKIGYFVLAFLGIGLAGCTFVPRRLWLEFLRGTGALWIYTSCGALIAYKLVPLFFVIWNADSSNRIADVTFNLVRLLLALFFRDLVVDPATRAVGTARFHVIVNGSCSGIEGAGLMLMFSIVWLWLFRRDCRFPHALLLIPVGIAIMFALNAVRIFVLILIGDAGAPQVAMGGFHSQAGWIAFNLVALAVCLTVPRISWLRSAESRPVDLDPNPSVPYLLPFAAILAAAMISRAFSARFEWLYPLRLFSAAAVLWFFRTQYKRLKWSIGWFSPLAGAAVFLMWLGLERGGQTGGAIASGLASLSVPMRTAWIVFRTLAAIATVPLAEELAFRGFLLRRLISSEFERVDPRRFTYPAVLVSSVLFGLMHGDRWIAGTIAGAVYAAAVLRRGSMGDAVLAHATTNALLAAWVVFGGNWQFW